MSSFFSVTKRGTLIYLRVTPNAQRDRIGNVINWDGQLRLQIRVKALPDKGRANTAAITLLANALRIPKSKMTLASGGKDRNKMILISGDAEDITTRFTDWMDETP